VKLLFDQNLSPRLVNLLHGLDPGSDHVQRLGLERSSDDAVWTHARDNDFIIVIKDDDFNQIAVIRGFPPKIVWIQLGNCTTDEIAEALKAEALNAQALVANLVADPDASTLVIRRQSSQLL
jgi:predicted nuclease of predicted toxin-antitoxin system